MQTHVIKRVEKLCERAVSVDAQDFLDLVGVNESFLEMTPPLTGRISVSRGGRIIGLLDKLSNLHSTSADAWKTVWKSMHENDILWSELEAEVSLRDLTMFVLQADNFKRAHATKTWSPQRPTGQALTAMVRSLMVFCQTDLKCLCAFTSRLMTQTELRRQDISEGKMAQNGPACHWMQFGRH